VPAHARREIAATLRTAASDGLSRCTGAPRLSLIAIVFVVLFLLTAPAPVQAQGFECARLQPAVGRVPAYGLVEDPARCEGFFARNVAQPFIEWVSLTRGPAAAGDGAAAPVFELRADARMALRVLLRPLRSGPFYRVDAPLAPGQTLRWDAATMPAATGLRAVDLGFLARVPSHQANPSAVRLAGSRCRLPARPWSCRPSMGWRLTVWSSRASR
jgi:hypothetical protein